MATIRNIRAEEFERVIAKGTVLAEFRASWCSYCKMMDPVVEQAAAAAPPGAVVVKIDVDQAPELAAKYEISTVPAFLRFQDGRLTAEFSGVQTKTKLIDAMR